MKKAISISLCTILCVGLVACGGPREVSNMEYSIEYGKETLNGTYTGTVMEKLPSGEGTFTCTDDGVTFIYTGNWEEGSMSGDGNLEYNAYTMTIAEDYEYIGEYKGSTVDGLPSGNGTFSSKNKEGDSFVYEGELSEGLFDGEGNFIYDSDEYPIFAGNYENGYYRPTVLQFLTSRGTVPDAEFSISDNARTFLETYPDIFTNNSTEGTDVEVDSGFSYAAFAKNPSKFGDKLFTVSGQYVVQIFENEMYGTDHTFMILDNNNGYGDKIYYVYMYGCADNIYEGSRVTLTALPLDYFTYKNVADQDIWAIACAGVSVS